MVRGQNYFFHKEKQIYSNGLYAQCAWPSLDILF